MKCFWYPNEISIEHARDVVFNPTNSICKQCLDCQEDKEWEGVPDSFEGHGKTRSQK